MLRSFLSLMALVAAAAAPGFSTSICADLTNCTFIFNLTNAGSTGNFGTVNLKTMGSDILVSVQLAPGLHLIQTGSHQSFDFNDTVGGGLALGGFSDGQYSQDAALPPFASSAFGAFDNAILTTAGPGANTTGVNLLTFKVLGHTNVNDLVDLSATPPGSKAYFSADVFAESSACRATGFDSPSCTGLLAVTGAPTSTVPEPTSARLVMGSLGLFAALMTRRLRKRSVVA